MNEKYYLLDDHEAIRVLQENQPIIWNGTCTSSEFIGAIYRALKELSRFTNSSVPIKFHKNTEMWFHVNGIGGSALRFGKNGWQNGRLKLAIAFCPDESEEEIEDVESTEIPLLEASLESVEVSNEPLDEIRKLAEDS